MAGNPAWKYLPSVQTAQSEREALFERANSLGSALRVLNDELGCDIPEHSDSKSWKFRCPWGEEHPDGGLDKNTRFYWDADRAFCFSTHGVLDLVGIRSLMWSVPTTIAAKRLVESYDAQNVRKPWRERIEAARDALLAKQSPRLMDTTHAHAALHSALRAIDGYIEAQYRPEVRQVVRQAQEMLDPTWDFETTMKWLDAATALVREKVKNG